MDPAHNSSAACGPHECLHTQIRNSHVCKRRERERERDIIARWRWRTRWNLNAPSCSDRARGNIQSAVVAYKRDLINSAPVARVLLYTYILRQTHTFAESVRGFSITLPHKRLSVIFHLDQIATLRLKTLVAFNTREMFSLAARLFAFNIFVEITRCAERAIWNSYARERISNFAASYIKSCLPDRATNVTKQESLARREGRGDSYKFRYPSPVLTQITKFGRYTSSAEVFLHFQWEQTPGPELINAAPDSGT